MASGSTPAQVNRNDPCPCGSGKKYKKCCMGRQGRAPGPAATAEPPAGQKALLREAAAHHQAGRLDAARDLYQQVLRERPKEAIALAYLGQIEGQLGEVASGIEHLRQAISIDPKRGPFHANLAALLLWAGRAEEALTSARRAVRLNPKDSLAHLTAGSCSERLNRLDEAARSLQTALRLDPANAEAGLLLAAIERRRDRLDEARQRVEGIIAARPDPIHMPRACHELGLICDRQGDYDAAFEAFQTAGRWKSKEPQAKRIDRRWWPRRIDRYRAGLTPELLGRWKRTTFDDGHPTPVFLVGFPRSGTTMTEQILAAHPRIVTTDERPFLGAVDEALSSIVPGAEDPVDRLAQLDPDRTGRLRAVYWQEVQSAVGEPVGEGVFIDKLPLNIVELGLISAVFPEARVIVALRDPRDACLSCFMQDFALNRAMIHFVTLEGTAEAYGKVMDLWLHVRPHLPLPFVEIRYEDTVEDLRGQAERILDLLGLSWVESMRSFHEKARQRFLSTPSYAAVTEPLHTRAVARWRHYAAHVEPVMPHLQRFITEFGYD